MDNQPHIEIDHPENRNGAQAVAFTYDMDKGPLSLPDHIRIGQKAHDGAKIENYTMQVEEFDIWLEDQIKNQNQEVMDALDLVYNKAIQNGIILVTRCVPSPYLTHAHVVKRTIVQLSQG